MFYWKNKFERWRKTHLNQATIKFLNLRTAENFAVIYKKIQAKRPKLRVFYQNDANGIANSEDPDQTAPLGAV